MAEEIKEQQKTEEIHQRLEKIGQQNTLFGNAIAITQFKNLEEKRKLKEKAKALFNGEMIRSILTPKDIDGNKRLDKLERISQSGDRSSNKNTMERADSSGKKTKNTLSTFPEILTLSFSNLLCKEGGKVYDPFMGHNSRATAILSGGRKYYAYDVHKFPLEFTKKSCSIFKEEDYELNLGSSEKIKYPDDFFDYSITCPPYADVEQYNKIYEEVVADDLSSKNYNDFLWVYNKCIKETYRVLKPGAYFTIVVGDIHRQGKYTSLMLDTIKAGKFAGFVLHDINIYNRKSNIGGDLNYKTFIFKCLRFPTIHEFIIIFKKPEYCVKCKKNIDKGSQLYDLEDFRLCRACFKANGGEIKEEEK